MITSTADYFTRQMRHKEKGKPDFSILSVFFFYLLFYFPAEFAGKELVIKFWQENYRVALLPEKCFQVPGDIEPYHRI